MILNNTDDRQQQGNLTGDTIKMGISDIRLIIDRLTDLYGDRELAALREYSTNALDAHIEAGITRPIEVTTPTPLSPFLMIRDFGIGLTHDDIREIYSQYGASTKRNTNAQTGALGLGCKSALSYTDQFTVTSTKDGVRIQVVVSRDPKEGATMKVVDTAQTTDENGTIITIPARAHNEFERKAKEFFRFWDKGTVILNGEQPEKLPGAQWVTDDLAIIEGNYNRNYVVMGGVPYPTPMLVQGAEFGYYKSVVAFVPIGSVDFAPSRESLMDTDLTKATIEQARRDLRAGITAAVQRDLDNAGTPAEAVKTLLRWNRTVPQKFIDKVTYKGKDVPLEHPVPDGTIITEGSGGYGKLSGHSKLSQFIGAERVHKSVWVHGWDRPSFTPTQKKKLLKWAEDDGVTPGNFILSKDKPKRDWMEPLAWIDWPTIDAIKLPRDAPKAVLASGRIPGSYDVIEGTDVNEGIPADDIDTTNPVFYAEGNVWYYRNLAEALNESYPGMTLVCMRANRIEKFCRNFPNARHGNTVIRELAEAWAKKQKPDDLLAYRMQSEHNYTECVGIDSARVDDPDLKYVVKMLNRDVSKVQDGVHKWNRLGIRLNLAASAKLPENPLHKYPLHPGRYAFTGRGGTFHAEHFYKYANMIYAGNKA